jgi:hypothetical protein
MAIEMNTKPTLFGKAQLSNQMQPCKEDDGERKLGICKKCLGKERKLVDVEVGGPFSMTSTEVSLACSGQLVALKYQGHRKTPFKG